MPKLPLMPLLAFAASAALIGAATLSVWAQTPVTAPPPHVAPPATTATSETIVLAGGCFWGVQAVFQHVEGVERAVSGYAGGTVAHPSYRQVSTGTTGHAESVEVTFDPRKVGLGQILQIYFSVAHDPTEVDRQGPDEGTQYRSEIFVDDAAEAKFARDYIAELDAAKVFGAPIATKVETLAAFYPAEAYHQNYATLHPGEPYIAFNDIPKVEALKRLFPERYRDKPTLVAAQ
jgi:peptide-methionine (S)-S-oxide reductase